MRAPGPLITGFRLPPAFRKGLPRGSPLAELAPLQSLTRLELKGLRTGEYMAHVLHMPRQGNTVESCIIVEWKKKEGDEVDLETPICEVETDKATFEVPAGARGVILKILHNAAEDVPVLKPIAVIGQPGEDWEALLAGQEVKRTPISPRARRRAQDENIPIAAIQGTGAEGRIIERDILKVLESRPPVTAAAKLAAQQGMSLPDTGSGLGGRIRLEDLNPEEQESTAGALEEDGSYTETPITGMRRLIAQRMLYSLSSAAQFTLTASADARALQTLCARFKEARAELGFSGITITDVVLFLVSRLLPLFPYMNARKVHETIQTWKHAHLGLAVDTPRGLMVPVIQNADTLSLEAISKKAKSLAKACLDGTITSTELSGSTFTITNLGNTGIESFTPIINAPEVAILGVCSLLQKPVPDGSGGYAFQAQLGFSLTVDHTVVDGAPAARFLNAFCKALQDIDLWIAK